MTAALDRAVEISRDRDIDLNNVDVLPVEPALDTSFLRYDATPTEIAEALS